jgi:hypothetical protein
MIDLQVSMAFALHANPGAYAVLVGSGVSVGAGIPTGRQVVLDLEFLITPCWRGRAPVRTSPTPARFPVTAPDHRA